MGGDQNNLAKALQSLGAHESGTARLEEAVEAYRAALQEITRERSPFQWALNVGGQGLAMMAIADRKNDAATAEQALAKIIAAYEGLQSAGQSRYADFFRRSRQGPRAPRSFERSLTRFVDEVGQ
jgi:hypothetical protein